MALPGAQISSGGNYRWFTLLRGILALIFGLIALFDPGIALLALVYVFGAYSLIDGIAAVFIAIQERRTALHWVALLIEGIVGIVIGILAFVLPGITVLALLFLIAIWAIITGIMEIAAGFMLGISRGLDWLLVVAGILSIIFGIILFAAPAHSILAILWVVGIYAIIFGIILIIRSFSTRPRRNALNL